MRIPRTVIILCATVFLLLAAAVPAHAQCEIQSVKYLGSVDTGAAYAVEVVGSYAYVGTQEGLKVIDISDVLAPQLVGSVSTPQFISRMAISGSSAYVVSPEGYFGIVDISDPAQPSIVGCLDINGFGVDISGSYAYVVGLFALYVIDVSDPSVPHIVDTLEAACGYDVEIRDNYAYVLDNPKLTIFDISNPMEIVQVGMVPLSLSWGLEIDGCTAYVGTSYGLKIIDITDPASPYVLGSIDVPGGLERVTVSGQYAYGNGQKISVIDISDLSHPFVVNLIGVGPELCAKQMDATGTLLFSVLTPWDENSSAVGRFQIFDISNPLPLPRIHELELSGAEDIAVSGTHAFITRNPYGTEGSLDIVDFSDLSVPKVVSSLTLPLSHAGVEVSGSYAYIVGPEQSYPYDYKLVVVNIADPLNPQIAAAVDMDSRLYAITISGDMIAVGGEQKLELFDISDPVSPIKISTIDTPHYSAALTIDGSHAYLSGPGSLDIIDISDPSAPLIAGFVTYGLYGTPSPPIWSSRVAVSGQYAYLADSLYGLVVIDVSSPAAPTVVTDDPRFPAHDIALAYPYVYLTGIDASLIIYDIQNSSAPLLAADVPPDNYNSYSSAFPVVRVSDSLAFFVDDGLDIIHLCPQTGGTPAIAVSPASYTFTLDEGTWTTGSLDIWNSGSGILSYFISSETNWITFSPNPAGSVGEHDLVETKFSAYNLRPGEYTAEISVADPRASNNPQRISASLTVLPVFFTLTTSVSPLEGGSITSNGTYEFRELVPVEATPNAGWRFDHWEGYAMSPSNPTTVYMNSDRNITAVFVPISYKLTTGVSPTGSGSVAGSGTYGYEQTASVSATPYTGWKFDHWEGDYSSPTDNPMSLFMDSDKNLTAVFVPNVLTQIQRLEPSSGTYLSSPPTFVWTCDGGVNNAFAIEVSFSYNFSSYWSTYEDGGQIIYDTSWTMPQSIWNRIASGKTIHWRVRGVDLYREPRTVVTSDKGWFLKK